MAPGNDYQSPMTPRRQRLRVPTSEPHFPQRSAIHNRGRSSPPRSPPMVRVAQERREGQGPLINPYTQDLQRRRRLDLDSDVDGWVDSWTDLA